MRKLLYSLLALAAICFPASAQGPIVGPGNIVLCPGVPGSPVPAQATFVGSAALAQLVAGVAGKSIYICGWHITNTATTGTFLFSYGTGSNCGTGTVTILPAQSVSSTAPATDHIDYAFAQLPAGVSLCQNSTATVSGIVYINQF